MVFRSSTLVVGLVESAMIELQRGEKGMWVFFSFEREGNRVLSREGNVGLLGFERERESEILGVLERRSF